MAIITSLIYVPVLVGILTIALVTAARRRSPQVIAFSALSFALVLWLFPQYLSQVFPASSHAGVALLLLRSTSALSNVMGVSFVIFVLLQTERFERYRRLLYALVCLAPIMIVLNYTPLMIRDVTASSAGITIQDAGFLYPVQIYLVAACFIFGVVLLERNARKMRKQLRASGYFLVIANGQAVLTIAISTLLFASSAAAQLVIPASLFIMVSMIAYSIVRHRLFDIRLVVARSLGYAAAILAVSSIYGFIVFGVLHLIFDLELELRFQLLLSVTTGASALLFGKFRKFFDRVTNSLFFRDAYDPQLLLDRLNKALVSTLDLEVLLRNTSTLLINELKVEFCNFIIEETAKTELHSIGRDDAYRSPEKVHEVLRHISENTRGNVISVDTLENVPSLREILTQERVEAFLCLTTHGQSATNSREIMGYCILGQKKSGNPYTNQDLRVLGTIANELSIAIQNALRFEEIENFNITLQQRIEEATRKLQRTNEKLRRLDQIKDDFISMASHQLRTPLTSVKGYVSMVLEGDAGKINPMQRKLLTQSYVSSQRMVYLISDLLNVSRLRTGKFVIEPVASNLAKVIKDEIEQLEETAKGRGLTLTYNKPEHFPTLMLDETKVRQVIMNFIDNAIYYTPSGGHITVNLVDKPQTIEFTVTDDGIGVPKHQQHHLFTKFFRAHNAKRARPDGTGLGLFMAKKVIVAQGGAIIFRSQEGKGSTFGFTFAKEILQTQAPQTISAKATS